MAEVIRMPRMSDTMEEGVIVGWLKEEGEEVESGETLAEVETDKATMELDSYSDGVLLHIAVKEGPVPINGVIAVIGEAGEDWKAALAAADEDNVPAEAQPEAGSKPEMPAETGTPETSEAQTGERVKASPLAKSMAREAGINLAEISGTGDHGRIIKRDIEAVLSGKEGADKPIDLPAAVPAVPKTAPAAPATSQKEAPAVPAFVFSGSEESEEVAMSQMRKAIARNVVGNKFTAPHFYLTIELDMEKAVAARAKMNEISPVKISFNDLVVKAAAVALRQHPEINASFAEGNLIRYHKHISIGVAVATPDGLLLPIIRHTDMKSLAQINSEVRTLAGLAREKKLPPDQMQGSTFTISNLGMFGIEEFTAIINRPNSCIMAVGAILDKPVVKNGEIVPGKRMKVTLSCDHRVVDGAIGAQFLQTFQSVLEDPIRMLI